MLALMFNPVSHKERKREGEAPDVDDFTNPWFALLIYTTLMNIFLFYQCPVFDLDHNIDFDGIHQTMTNKATIFLQVSCL